MCMCTGACIHVFRRQLRCRPHDDTFILGCMKYKIYSDTNIQKACILRKYMCTCCKTRKERFSNPLSQESTQLQEIEEDRYIVFENRCGAFCLVVAYLTMRTFLSRLITHNLKFPIVKEGTYMKKRDFSILKN